MPACRQGWPQAARLASRREPTQSGGRAPQAGKPTPKRPQGARSGPAAKASPTRHAGRPARQVWGCGPSRPRSGPRRCVEGCAGGQAHRRATGTLPPRLPTSIAARANTIALRNSYGQTRQPFFSELGAKKPPQRFQEPSTAVSARLSAGCAGKPANAALCALFRLSAGFGFAAQHACNGTRGYLQTGVG